MPGTGERSLSLPGEHRGDGRYRRMIDRTDLQLIAPILLRFDAGPLRTETRLWLCRDVARVWAHISVDVEGRGIFQRDFVRLNLKFPNIDRGPSAANEQGTNVHKLRQLGSVCSRFEPRSLDKIVTHHDLCAKRLCLLFKPGRDIDGITDKRWTKAS